MSDIQIAGATFTDVPSIQVPKVGGGFATYSESGGSAAVQMGVLRGDATRYKRIAHYDKLIFHDEGISLPSYSTTATTLKASSAISPTETLNLTDYNWFILERCLTIPIYANSVANTKAKGRFEYGFTETAYEVVDIPVGSVHSLIDSSKSNASQSTTMVAIGAFSRIVYWSSASAVATYSTTAYGTVQAIVAPTLSTDTVTFNTPNMTIRGSSSYFVNTFYNGLSDIRYQYIIDLWRVKKAANNPQYDGWAQTTQARWIVDCAHYPTHELK